MPQVLFLTGFDQWCVLNFYMVVATQGDKVAIVNCGMPDDLDGYQPVLGGLVWPLRTASARRIRAYRGAGAATQRARLDRNPTRVTWTTG